MNGFLAFKKSSAKMRSGTVVHWSDDTEHARAEVVLCNGDRIELALDRDGLAITQSAGPSQPAALLLFEADPSLAASICAGLGNPKNTSTPAPLHILAAALVGLSSAEEVKHTFRKAAEQVMLFILHNREY
jgi:hypothetical protein